MGPCPATHRRRRGILSPSKSLSTPRWRSFTSMHCELIWRESGARTKDRHEQLETSLPADLQVQYQQLSDWVREMVEAHGRRLRFRIVDAASVEGCIKSLRYGVRRYPAVIVDGREKSMGTSFEHATALVERRLAGTHG